MEPEEPKKQEIVEETVEEKEIGESKEEKKRDAPAEEAVDDGGRPKREKRARKSADAFVPEDFSKIDRSVQIIEGRGKKLGDIDIIVESVESVKNASELETTHRLMFATKGKPSLKDMKSNILKFNGFLKKKQEGQSEEELKAQDDEAEAKMGAKAYKLTVSQIKKVCDQLKVDRTKMNDKDTLVDALLDFLGAPDEKFLKGGSKKSSSSKKTSGCKAKQAEEDESESDDDEPMVSGKMPSDKALRKWTRAYVRCFNMESSTIRDAVKIASDKFGVDLSEKKALLKELITEEMIAY